MEITYLIFGFLIGGLIGALVIYFVLKSSMIARSAYEELNHLQIKNKSDLENSQNKISELNEEIEKEKNNFLQQNDLYDDLKNEFSKISAEYTSLQQQYTEQKHYSTKLIAQLEIVQNEKQTIFAKNVELSALNENFKQSLDNQKEEISKIQEDSKIHFENLANRILEEKTQKFTALNNTNLKNILDPFQEKINDLKDRVNEAYAQENKERFSLSEKVKELALLNQQISEDAKKLTRALKGESKTQGNWGEMILESILEKSGLAKGREYFLEHELRDEDNKALFSEFSGKKMRPDAVIKYPDERNVIIDSKVSLTAYIELVDELDPDIYQIKINQHLHSIKTHINQLSQKAYDDYGKSLDFVMMFIPSEPAYIAAMQADQNLWNFAYEKRILLLNPSNLITSLKLIADLWKREYQNKNAMEIAERGAKLYDKFVNFVENLEKVGKNLDNAKNVYNDAFKQLHTGNDNLIIQTQKLKSLGIKNKKDLPQSLIDNSDNLLEY
ncbi:DNA recombination protein RmuC [Chryseobacterium sp.]|uniref:DNA recombination protein RmuC n=1 Tax=Chryseobacterium sp. TaxID=1871047 RepID=UPI00388FC2C6